jgi:hypothetical protein
MSTKGLLYLYKSDFRFDSMYKSVTPAARSHMPILI